MKRLNILLLSFIVLSSNLLGQMTFGENHKMNDHWRFYLGNPNNAAEVDFDDHQWRELDLPHDWSIEGQLSPTLASCTGYLPGGIGWYRKTIDIPDNKKGEKVYLYFEGIYNRSEVYINGQLLGKRPNGYISFMYDATPYIEYDKENIVAVKVDHSQSADSRWYTGSGIYRNVWLVYSGKVHLKQWGVFAYPKEASEQKGVLAIHTDVVNETEEDIKVSIRHELFTGDGKQAGTVTKDAVLTKQKSVNVVAGISVEEPKLWSTETPNLYKLRTTVLKGAQVLDKSEITTGFRSFTFNPDSGFALNGEWMKLKGVCLHHDAGVLGAAVPRKVWKERLKILKDLGCNAIRTSHNPQSPDLYDLCDELGFLVMNEAFDEWEYPKRKWLEGWNVGTPGFQGSYDFFEEWSSRDMADMVRRDRNHISIFTWSIGNEVDYPNDPYSHPILDGSEISQPMYGGYKPDNPDAMRLGDIAHRLVAEAKKYDTSRPVTAALAGVIMSNETDYPAALDITGYNYTENRYQIDHEKYPERIIYGSENRHDYQAWLAVKENEHIFGQFLWTGFDYLGESGSWPSRGLYTGLVDFAGNVKPRGQFRKALWSDSSFIYIGTYPKRGKDYKSIDAWPNWNYDDDRLIRVVCYTNMPQALLKLDGDTVGKVKEYDSTTGIIAWDIPYTAGKLEAIGLDSAGVQRCTYAIQSSKRPYAIDVSTNDSVISKNRGLAIVKVQVVDENGIPVFFSDDKVTCKVNGPAKLLGLEAGNNSDMSDYTDNKHRLFHGNMIAYLQATGEKGEIEVNFSAPWLKSDRIKIRVD